MKTAMMCWCLFSIAFALPVPQSPHTDDPGKSKMKQDACPSDLNQDTNEQENSRSSDVSDDTNAEKDAEIHPVHKAVEAQEVVPSEGSQEAHTEAANEQDPLSSDKSNGITEEKGSRSMNLDANKKMGSRLANMNRHTKEKKVSVSSDKSDGTNKQEVSVSRPQSRKLEPLTAWLGSPLTNMNRHTKEKKNSHPSDMRDGRYNQEDLTLIKERDGSDEEEEMLLSDVSADMLGQKGVQFPEENDPEILDESGLQDGYRENVLF